jgi:hypothetical protein
MAVTPFQKIPKAGDFVWYQAEAFLNTGTYLDEGALN